MKRPTHAPARAPERPQPRGLSLRTNVGWTFAGNVVYAACQWGILVVLSKLGLPEDVGLFSLGLAITAPVVMFTNLQLRSVQATDARRHYAFGHYLALRLVMTALALLAIATIVLVTGYGGEVAAVVAAVAGAKALESISDVYYGLFQQRERMDRIATSMILKGLISLAAVGAAMALTHRVLWCAAALALVWGCVLLLYDVRNGARFAGGGPGGGHRPLWERRTLRRLALLALPMGIVMMLLSLNTNIPRFLIERYLGERELGFYAAMTYLVVAGTTLVNALGNAAAPRLAQQYARGERRAFTALMTRLCGLGLALGVAGVAVAAIAGRPLLSLLYRPEYGRHADVFVWVMIAGGIGYVASFFGEAATAARRFVPQAVVFGLVAATTLGTGLALVPSRGLIGGAQALAAAALVQLVGSALIVAHALGAPGRPGGGRRDAPSEVIADG